MSKPQVQLTLTVQEAKWIAECLAAGAIHLADKHNSLSAWARRCAETLNEKAKTAEAEAVLGISPSMNQLS